MSLTSYRAAPPRVSRGTSIHGGIGTGERERVGNAGLAATYSSAPWGAVPSALRVFTAEFGMGSGVWPLAMATRPAILPHGSGDLLSCEDEGEVSGGRVRGLAAARGQF